MAETEPKGWVPPYISFTTLTGLLDRMHGEGGAPPQIDRSYLVSFSGGYQAQVIAALKSLGLIIDNGAVADALTQLVEAPDRKTREPIIADLVRQFYPEPVRLGGIKATQGQLEAAFRDYGITGDTLRKAIAFYLAAAKYSQVQLSANFRVPSVGATDGRKAPRKATRRRDDGQPDPDPGEERERHRDDEDDWQDNIDPAILAWLKRIPTRDDIWEKADRDRWVSVLLALFGGIFGEAEQ